MASPINLWLVTGAILSAAAACLHVGIIVAGASWYRFFGAGERMARLAEAGSWRPAATTAVISVVLFVWSAYALSGSGLINEWVWTKWVLAAITAIYTVRGLILFPIAALHPHRMTPFVIWSSLICLGFGVVHLIGTVQVWDNL